MTNEKMAEYMRKQRSFVDVSVNGNLLKININEMLKINKVLHIFGQFLDDKEIEEMLKVNKNLLKINTEMLKINTEMLKINTPENLESGEISQKTPFLLENSSPRGERGEGGCGADHVYLNESFIINQSIKQNENLLKINNSKNQNPNSQNNQEMLKVNKKENFKKISNIAQNYWAIMYEECRKKSSFKKFVLVFLKIQKDIPSIGIFAGTLKLISEDWNEGFYPSADKWLNDEVWNGLSAKTIAKIKQNEKEYEKMANYKISKFNRESV